MWFKIDKQLTNSLYVDPGGGWEFESMTTYFWLRSFASQFVSPRQLWKPEPNMYNNSVLRNFSPCHVPRRVNGLELGEPKAQRDRETSWKTPSAHLQCGRTDGHWMNRELSWEVVGWISGLIYKCDNVSHPLCLPFVHYYWKYDWLDWHTSVPACSYRAQNQISKSNCSLKCPEGNSVFSSNKSGHYLLRP